MPRRRVVKKKRTHRNLGKYKVWVHDLDIGWTEVEREKVGRPVHRNGRGTNWRKGLTGHMAKAKVSQLDNDEKTAILLMSSKGKTVQEIGRSLNRHHTIISRYIARMADTSVLAKATLKAGAQKLAERVVKKASVGESIEVLSRPGMDVLQPAQQKGSTGGGGFRVSVGVGSCGTVVQVESGDGKQRRELDAPAKQLDPATIEVQGTQG